MTHTNTQQKAPRACDSEGLHTNTNNADFRSHEPIQQALDGNKTTWLTLAYTRIKDGLTGFYIDRAIGIEAVAMLILMAVFVTVRVFQ
jgi:hypothetical protein